MIDSTLEDGFGSRYILTRSQRDMQSATCQPLRFSNADTAFSFVNRLRAPHGYWQRALSSVSSSAPPSRNTVGRNTVGRNYPERQISELLYRKRIFIYELIDYSTSSSGAHNRSIEQPNGDKLTFSHASILLASHSLQKVELKTAEDAQQLLQPLAGDKQQLDELAASLRLAPLQGADSDASHNAIIAALMAGEVVVTVQQKLASPPEPETLLEAITADKPVDSVSDSVAAVIAAAEPVSNINVKSQAETLKEAAEKGSAFCEECEKAKAVNNT